MGIFGGVFLVFIIKGITLILKNKVLSLMCRGFEVFDRSIKKPVYLEVRPNQNIRAFLCLNLAMIPILESFFNRNFTS